MTYDTGNPSCISSFPYLDQTSHGSVQLTTLCSDSVYRKMSDKDVRSRSHSSEEEVNKSLSWTCEEKCLCVMHTTITKRVLEITLKCGFHVAPWNFVLWCLQSCILQVCMYASYVLTFMLQLVCLSGHLYFCWSIIQFSISNHYQVTTYQCRSFYYFIYLCQKLLDVKVILSFKQCALCSVLTLSFEDFFYNTISF